MDFCFLHFYRSWTIERDSHVECWNDQECQNSRGDESSDDHRRQRALDFSAHASRQRHRQKAEACDQCSHQHRPQSVHRTLRDSLIRREACCFKLSDVTKQHDAIEDSNSKQGDKTDGS